MANRYYFYLLLILFLLTILSLSHSIIYQLFAASNDTINTTKHVEIIAHRGASKLAPENTLSAISIALNQEVDMIEIDVHLTKDNKLVVIHDELLERTTNGFGKVSDYSLKELKKLDAGSWFDERFTNERLPTLHEVLTLINGRATCLIEIKWQKGNPYLGIEMLISREIINLNATKWVIVQSFESTYLENIHTAFPSIRLGKLLIGSWSFPLPFHYDYQFHWGNYSPPQYIDWVIFYHKRATPHFIKSLQNKGVKVGVFTPSTQDELRTQLNWGVDAVITNEPTIEINLLTY